MVGMAVLASPLLSTPPARRGGHRSPFFRRRLRALLCGAGVEPPRGRGRPSGARESQLFWGYVTTTYFQRSIWTILRTTTEEHYTDHANEERRTNTISGATGFRK